jgi:hypothetical protein
MRLALVLPPLAGIGLGLGALALYAGSTGYSCAGRFADTRTIAHPPVGWPAYLGLSLIVLALSMIPALVIGRTSTHD